MGDFEEITIDNLKEIDINALYLLKPFMMKGMLSKIASLLGKNVRTIQRAFSRKEKERSKVNSVLKKYIKIKTLELISEYMPTSINNNDVSNFNLTD